MTFTDWILGGVIAALFGAGLSKAFRLPSVILASAIATVAGSLVANWRGAGATETVSFVALLLVVLQGAYLAGALTRGRNGK